MKDLYEGKEKETWYSIIIDIMKAFGFVLLVGFILTIVMVSCADAQEIEWFPDYPIAWIGAEYDVSSNPVTCRKDGAGINGNVGIRQGLMQYKAIRFNGLYQHHSCAFSSDSIDYNSVGINMEFDFGKWLKHYR